MDGKKILEIITKIEAEVLKAKKILDGLRLKTKSEKDVSKALRFSFEMYKTEGYIKGVLFVYRLIMGVKNND